MKAEEKRFAEIGKIERKEYDKLKRRAIKFENANRKYILVLPCDGENGWCEMGDTSALIYKYYVCEELGIPVMFTEDLESYYTQYTLGRVRTRGFDTVRERIKKAGLYKEEIDKDKTKIFVLNRRFSDEEIEELENKENERQAAINEIVKVKFADPILYQKMVQVATRLHQVCFRRLDKLSSQTNGKYMVELADSMLREYFYMTDANNPDWDKLYGYTRKLLIELQITASLKLWTRVTCVNISEEVLDIQNRITKQKARGTSKSK